VAPSSSSSSPKKNTGFIPPSESYLNIIRQGAALWNLDQQFQDYLSSIPTASSNLVIPEGTSGRLLQTARMVNPRSKDIEQLLRQPKGRVGK
jgi:hypothetical protein